MTLLYRVRTASSGWTGAPGLNTFYFSGNVDAVPPGTTSDLAKLAHDRVCAGFAAFLSQLPTVWTALVSPNVDVINDVNGDLVNSYSVVPTATLQGTAPVGFLPISSMVLLRLNTSTFSDGSRLQGRAFIGPVAASVEGDGTPTASMITSALAMGTALQDVGISGLPVIGVWRRPRAANPLKPLLPARVGSFAPITSITVPDKFAVLRSRRD